MKRLVGVHDRQLWQVLAPLGALCIILVGGSCAQSAEPVGLAVDGQQITSDPPARMRDGRVVGPLRPVLQAMGYMVTWDAGARVMTARAGDTVLRLQARNRQAQLGDRVISLPVAPWRERGSLHGAIAPVAAVLGARVGWDAAGRVASITTARGTVSQPPTAGGTGSQPPASDGTGSQPPASDRAVTKERAMTLATQYLKSIRQYPDTVTEIKATREQAPANNYWPTLASGEPIKSDAPMRPCWVVAFIYQGFNPGSYKHVYVDEETGKVIGGQQSR